jgi:hypothetical protein
MVRNVDSALTPTGTTSYKLWLSRKEDYILTHPGEYVVILSDGIEEFFNCEDKAIDYGANSDQSHFIWEITESRACNRIGDLNEDQHMKVILSADTFPPNYGCSNHPTNGIQHQKHHVVFSMQRNCGCNFPYKIIQMILFEHFLS